MIRINWISVGNLFFATSLFLGCQSKPDVTFNDHELIKGNASPVLLIDGKNEINLEDYVLDLSKLDSINVPDELKSSRNGNMLTLEGSLKTNLAEIKLWSQEQS